MLKRILALIFVAMLTMSSIGCNKGINQIFKYDINAPINIETTQTVSTNANYELVWSKENNCVMLNCLSNGKVWSNIPYEFIQNGESNAIINSTINLNVMSVSTMKWEKVRGYSDAIVGGRVESEKIENGIRVIYYFDKYGISIPVEYTLRDNSIETVIKTKEIVESGNYLLVSISLDPYFTSASNADADAYLFVPTGSGALMYTDERVEKSRDYIGTVYGEDASRVLPETTVGEEQINLPVFGSVQSNGNALFGIIENGAETAVIEAQSGNSRTKWSNVYPTFYVRGYDVYKTNLQTWSYKDLKYVSDDMCDVKIKVGYYPLMDGNANYNGMAKCYKNFLKSTNQLKKSDIKQNIYSLNVLGGMLKTVATGGIPHQVTSVLTSFSDAQEIIANTIKITGVNPSVQLLGFGDNGIDVGKIAGGYKFSKDFGSNKERLALEKYCKDNNINIFTDFDLLKFNSSANGFSYQNDCAKSATFHVAESYYINNPLRTYDKEHPFRFLQRSEISKAVGKLISFADKKNISGVSLTSLGSVVYSDYSDLKYSVKGNTEKDVTTYIERIKKSGHKIAVSYANSYAATTADTIYGTPLTNGNYDSFDEWVPFYQLVFSGSKPMYTDFINITDEKVENCLKAVATGIGLSFAAINNYDSGIAVNTSFPAYATVYKSNENLIKSTIETYGKYINATSGAELISYNETDGLSVSVFSNDVILYVNHTENSLVSPIGEILAHSVQMVKG